MKQLTLVAMTLLLVSCASVYKGETPIDSNLAESKDQIELVLDHNVTQINGNRLFSKRLSRNNYSIAKVEITNNSSEAVTVGRELQFLSNNNPLPFANGAEVYNAIRQKAGAHFLYLLLTFMTFDKTKTVNGETSTSSTPIGVVVGPTTWGINFGIAQSANMRLRAEIRDQNVYHKTIQPGETLTGFATFATKNIGFVTPAIVK